MIPSSMNIFAVAIGGGFGALARYGLTLLFTQTPLSTLVAAGANFVGGGASFAMTIANLLGCLMLGGLYQWVETLAALGETPFSPRFLLALRVGVLGSLTTFSTLIGDVAILGSEGRTMASLSLLSLNLIGGLLFFILAATAVRGVLS